MQLLEVIWHNNLTLTLKIGNELSTLAQREAGRRRSETEVIWGVPFVENHRASWLTECVANNVQGQSKASKDALESRLQRRLG